MSSAFFATRVWGIIRNDVFSNDEDEFYAALMAKFLNNLKGAGEGLPSNKIARKIIEVVNVDSTTALKKFWDRFFLWCKIRMDISGKLVDQKDAKIGDTIQIAFILSHTATELRNLETIGAGAIWD